MNSNGSESSDSFPDGTWVSNAQLANQVISKYAGDASTTANKRKSASITKNDEEYSKKRARNNQAVKKSREKAKNRIADTQVRVEQLSQENEELQTKVTLLSKELNVLRALFTNGGFTLPCDYQLLNNNNSNGSDHHQHQTHDEDPIRHHLPSHPPTSVPEKSAFHSPEDTKIPPLRPMPRVVNSTNRKVTSPTHPVHRSYTSPERDNIFNFKHKLSIDYETKAPKPAPPPLIQPGPSSITSNLQYSK